MPDDAAAVVRKFLAERGVSEIDIDRAEASGSLTALVLDQLIMPGVPIYTAKDIAEAAGEDADVLDRLWRAMGFADVPEDEVAFYESDLTALKEVRRDHDRWADLENDINQARPTSATLSRLAEVTTDNLMVPITALREAGAGDAEIAGALIEVVDLDRIQRTLNYVFRRQWQATVWRRLGRTADGASAGVESNLAVGFVDLVRFTALTEQVAEDELARVVSRFEELSHEVVVSHRGRVVKMIGDAVMYVTDGVPEAVLAAVDLVDAYAADELLPPARAGIASGPMLARGGDYFGPVVNLASRIVDVARPNAVVCSEDVHEPLAGDERFEWRRLPRMRLKGIGWTSLWRLRHR